MDINLKLRAAKALAKAEANEEIVAVTKELRALKEELATSKEDSNSMKEERAKARDSQKLTQEALDGANRQLSAINARLDKQRTELDSKQSVRHDLEAELVVTAQGAGRLQQETIQWLGLATATTLSPFPGNPGFSFGALIGRQACIYRWRL